MDLTLIMRLALSTAVFNLCTAVTTWYYSQSCGNPPN